MCCERPEIGPYPCLGAAALLDEVFDEVVSRFPPAWQGGSGFNAALRCDLPPGLLMLAAGIFNRL
jgi:hypothetical protein